MSCRVNSHMPSRAPAILRQCHVLRESPRGSRKKPNAGRSPTYRLWTADANSHMPCHAHAALCHGLQKSLSERLGRGMAYVNQTWPHCANQMGKTQSKPLAARHGRGTAWHVWISLNRHLTCMHLYAVNTTCTVVSTWAVVRVKDFVFACLGQQATTQTDVSHKLPITHGVVSLLQNYTPSSSEHKQEVCFLLHRLPVLCVY
jgi:hypothetical protein